jgi:hypothetical protein
MRKQYRSSALWLSLILLTLETTAWGQSFDRQKAGVVRVTSQVEGMRRTGTGFIVSLDSDAAYIVTASHVVEGDSQPHVEFFTKRNATVQAETARIEGGDPRGLALLIVRGKDNLPAGLSALPIAQGSDLKGGEPVTVIGFPQGGGSWAVLRANVVSREGRDLMLDGSIAEGNSGGPVLMGESVIGVITQVGGAGKFGRAVPAPLVRLVLDGWGVRYGKGAGEVATTSSTAPVLRVERIVPGAAQPADYKGPCPAVIDFTWKVWAAGSGGNVSYQVVRGDGVIGDQQTLAFEGPGSKDVRASWQLGSADSSRNYSSWVALRVLGPQKLDSDKIPFKLQCVPGTREAAPATGAGSVKILRAACEKLRSGTAFRITLNGEGQGPDGAVLQPALFREAKQLSRPKISCSDWKTCQRQAGEPEKTRWTISAMILSPAPTEATVSLETQAGGSNQPPYAVARAELDCLLQ